MTAGPSYTFLKCSEANTQALSVYEDAGCLRVMLSLRTQYIYCLDVQFSC